MASEVAMPVFEWLGLMALAGLAGAGGQVGRMVIGLKKLNDEAVEKEKKLVDLIDVSRLTVSIVIGMFAGVLGMLATHDPKAPITASVIWTFVATGYLGTDVIEGMMSRYLPSKTGKDEKAGDGAAADGGGANAPTSASTATASTSVLSAPVIPDAVG
jgi:hypothetical protein